MDSGMFEFIADLKHLLECMHIRTGDRILRQDDGKNEAHAYLATKI